MLRLVQLSVTLFLINGAFCQEEATCTLPDSSQTSKCKRAHHCDSLWLPIKEKKVNYTDGIANLMRHQTCSIQTFVCCPDKFEPVPLPTYTNTPVPPTPVPSPATKNPLVPQRSDLTAIRQHKNYGLLNSAKCGMINVDKIIGGEEADLGEYPWMALLKFNLRSGETSYGCGGSLITPLFVLTAAHCMSRELVQVRLGEHSLNNTRDCDFDNYCLDPVQDIDIKEKIKHKKYSYNGKLNDIGLLKLVHPADMTKNNVNTVCLPLKPEDQIEWLKKNNEKVLKSMTITGWGKIADGSKSDVMLKAYVPFVENSECKKRYFDAFGNQIPIYPSQLCAGGVQNGTKVDTCNGDSGGPIQTFSVRNSLPRSFIYGVVSAGLECLHDDKRFPGVYTDIAYYLDWILDNINEN